jgi:NADPH:quinone reductase-like Zn-dependent oxidoreductase
MRAYERNGVNGPDSLTVSQRPDPELRDSQILIRMHAWSLNFRDLLIVNGEYGGKMPDGTIPLSDGAGEVVAVGSHVTRFKIGDRVCPAFSSTWYAGEMTNADLPTSLGGSIDGVLCELFACDERAAVKIPDHLSYQEAACLPCAGVTAWNALFGPRPVVAGQTVLTLGTGGVSTFAIQFAAAVGARVISTSSNEKKLDIVRRLGASETINYRTHPNWDEEVLRLTQGKGVDHIVEVGGGGTLERSMACLAMSGQIHMIGVLTQGQINPLPLIPWKTLRGILVGSTADFEAMNRMIGHLKLRPLIDRAFAFEEVGNAYRYLASATHIGKVIIQPTL